MRILGDRGYLYRGADLDKVQSWHDSKIILMLREKLEAKEGNGSGVGMSMRDLDGQLIDFLAAKVDRKDVGATGKAKRRNSGFESANSGQ